jgi:RNA polymerase sigma-70 factor (ECF subfamily)
MLWNRQDCQDLIHDAFLRVWRQRQRIDMGSLDALIWTTALNLARNRLRWRRRQQRQWRQVWSRCQCSSGAPARISNAESARRCSRLYKRRHGRISTMLLMSCSPVIAEMCAFF